MAKELPYFKFEPSEWLEGEIQICSDTAIVCFIDLCSGYWTKIGCISYAFALQKYCRKDASVIQELIDNKIIYVEDENIRIKFLDKQLEEFNSVSEKRRKSAESRWNNANALQMQSKSNAIREDKSREDKSRDKVTNVTSVDSKKIDWGKLLEFFNKTFGKNCTVVNESVKKKYLARLKDGYTKEQIMDAMVNASRDNYHKEDRYKHCTLEFFSRPDKIDKWANVSKPVIKQYNPR